MTFKEKVNGLIAEALLEKPSIFLIDLAISDSFKISVGLDGDNGVALQDCIDVSRAVENNLDREEHDFSLQVMSSGLSEPLASPRQFRKNIGRELEILLTDLKEIEGELTKVDEEKITLVMKYRKPKEVGKGKVDVVEEREIPYTEIKKALVAVKF